MYLIPNSYVFIYVFYPLTLAACYYSNSNRLIRKSKAFLASLFSYSWWNVAFLPLNIRSLIFNYFIEGSDKRTQDFTKILKNDKSAISKINVMRTELLFSKKIIINPMFCKRRAASIYNNVIELVRKILRRRIEI